MANNHMQLPDQSSQAYGDVASDRNSPFSSVSVSQYSFSEHLGLDVTTGRYVDYYSSLAWM